MTPPTPPAPHAQTLDKLGDHHLVQADMAMERGDHAVEDFHRPRHAACRAGAAALRAQDETGLAAWADQAAQREIAALRHEISALRREDAPDGTRAALEKAKAYIVEAQRHTGLGLWERGRHSGLQEALNAIAYECAALAASPAPAPTTEAELRHALWNIAGTIVAISDDPDGARQMHAREVALSETSPLVDAARDAIRRFNLSNATAPAPSDTGGPQPDANQCVSCGERDGQHGAWCRR